MFSFHAYNLPTNLWIFTAAAGAVWIAGTKIADYTDEMAERFALSRALLGLLLLAGVTSLPEIATSLTAARSGNPVLAVNNLLGGIAMQVALLAIADIVSGKHALTSAIPNPMVMLQGAFNVCLLTFVTLIVLIGDVPFLGAGAGSWTIFALALYSFVKVNEADKHHPWVINEPDDSISGRDRSYGDGESERPLKDNSLTELTGVFLVGLVERANRTFLRMGVDSLAMLIVYSSGMVLLYAMREGQ